MFRVRLIPRIHLGTAIILMFVAGTLTALNAAKSSGLVHYPYDQFIEFINYNIIHALQRNCDSYGWPLNAVHFDSSTGSVFLIEYGYIACDVLFGIAILALTAFLCEYLPTIFSRKQFPA